MPILASLSAVLFGWGLTISGMIQPAKVLGFLDVFGIPSGVCDPSLAVVMAARLAVAGIGYALARGGRRYSLSKAYGRIKKIDRPLIPARCCSASAGASSDSVPDRRSPIWRRCRARDRFRRRHDDRHAATNCGSRAATLWPSMACGRLGHAPSADAYRCDQFSLDADQIAVRDMARAFADEVFAPNALAWDEAKHFPVAEMRKAAALGMGGILHRRGCRRLGPVAAGRDADLRGAGDRLSRRSRPICRSTT